MSRPAAVLRLANMRKLNAAKLAIPKATDMIRQEAVSKPAEESVAQISKPEEQIVATQAFKSKEQPMAAQAPISEEHPTAVHILKPEEQPKAAEASTSDLDAKNDPHKKLEPGEKTELPEEEYQSEKEEPGEKTEPPEKEYQHEEEPSDESFLDDELEPSEEKVIYQQIGPTATLKLIEKPSDKPGLVEKLKLCEKMRSSEKDDLCVKIESVLTLKPSEKVELDKKLEQLNEKERQSIFEELEKKRAYSREISERIYDIGSLVPPHLRTGRNKRSILSDADAYFRKLKQKEKDHDTTAQDLSAALTENARLETTTETYDTQKKEYDTALWYLLRRLGELNCIVEDLCKKDQVKDQEEEDLRKEKKDQEEEDLRKEKKDQEEEDLRKKK
ncbi:hypothetical protein CPB97_003303 [Podila verticillata]|nr:hypothetical protein CPB97_003303 [Podila verticillata]